MDEVILVGEESVVFCARIGADEDHKVLVIRVPTGWRFYRLGRYGYLPKGWLIAPPCGWRRQLLLRALDAMHVGHVSFGTLGFIWPSMSRRAFFETGGRVDGAP